MSAQTLKNMSATIAMKTNVFYMVFRTKPQFLEHKTPRNLSPIDRA